MDKIEVEGGETKDALTLYYRDGLECFRFLFANPLLSNYMDYTPRREYVANDKCERLYNELMTGDLAWTLQVCHDLSLNTYDLILETGLCWTRRNTWLGPSQFR